MIKLRLSMILSMLLLAAVFVGISPAKAGVLYQCPTDTEYNDTQIPYGPNDIKDGISDVEGVTCIHSSAGDGFIMMADRRDPVYVFGYHDVTADGMVGYDPYDKDDIVMAGTLAGEVASPTIINKEGDTIYWTLTNVGMQIRPDLFDAHTIHYHGFPHNSSIFDGVPDVSISINQLASQTYYFKETRPGTYIYHCHVEATEHMQMGMYGNVWVQPWQNLYDAFDEDGLELTYNGHPYRKYAYNDGDGSTGYDVEFPFMISGLDSVFHDASRDVQPLPFGALYDDYGLINGRGYPDTKYASIPTPPENGNQVSQNVDTVISATQGETIYLHVSNLSVIRCYSLASLGIPMKVVGKDLGELKSANGQKLHYFTNSLEVCGGETLDVIMYTDDVQPGTYFLYTTNLNYLSNDTEDFGGIMTEVVIN
ncbi:MAG: multicopper oxidase domain-containing protein [Gammaproteobacteria bacterium]|nr:multicopper oxidase domain-containing protein [Gammaproteobacteria bacterium]